MFCCENVAGTDVNNVQIVDKFRKVPGENCEGAGLEEGWGISLLNWNTPRKFAHVCQFSCTSLPSFVGLPRRSRALDGEVDSPRIPRLRSLRPGNPRTKYTHADAMLASSIELLLQTSASTYARGCRGMSNSFCVSSQSHVPIHVW